MLPNEPTDEHPIVALIFEVKSEIEAVRSQLNEVQEWIDHRTEQEERAALEAELREKWEAEKEQETNEETAKSTDAAARLFLGIARKWWHIIVVGTGGTGVAAAIGLSGDENAAVRHRALPTSAAQKATKAYQARKENDLNDPARGAVRHKNESKSP